MVALTTPPAKALARWRDVICALTAPCDWQSAWCEYFAAHQAYGFGSARAGMVLLLSYLAQKCERREVLLPAYTCSTVAKSVEAAGLVPILCDFAPDSSWPDPERLKKLASDRTLAVVAANLFGIPDPMTELREVADSVGAYLIEDLSLSLGGDYKGKRLGTFGHATIVSLGVSKVITTYKGGILALRESLLPPVGGSPFSAAWSAGNLKALVMLGLYPFLLSRAGFGLLQATPLRLNDNPEVLVSAGRRDWSSFQAQLSAAALRGLAAQVAQRRERGLKLKDMVELAGFVPLAAKSAGDPAYLRYPIRCASYAEREGLLAALRRRGIHASRGFVDIKPHLNANDHPHSLALCDTMLTLPSHPAVSDRDIEKMAAVLKLRKSRS